MTVKVNRRVSISVENSFDAPDYGDEGFNEDTLYPHYEGGLDTSYDFGDNAYEAYINAAAKTPESTLVLLEQAIAEIRSAL